MLRSATPLVSDLPGVAVVRGMKRSVNALRNSPAPSVIMLIRLRSRTLDPKKKSTALSVTSAVRER
eukprot:14518324-Alexandrium_andersonii.AAC.1